jgi:hypothetical protein
MFRAFFGRQRGERERERRCWRGEEARGNGRRRERGRGRREAAKTKLASRNHAGDDLQLTALTAAPSAPEPHRHRCLVPNLRRPRPPPPPPAGTRLPLRSPAGDGVQWQLRPPRLVRRRGYRPPAPRS